MKTITIFSFMIKDLKLKGADLLVYALIYSFSQYGQICFMKPDKMADELGISRSQVFRALSHLLNRNLIDSNTTGYMIFTRDMLDTKTMIDLDEMIRIAKTPWLE